MSDKVVTEEGFVCPLSFAQERLWFLDRFAPGKAVYNIPMVLTLSGPLNVPALEQSFNLLVERHEILRTTFTTQDDRPVQVVAPSLTLELPVVDLSSVPEAERAERVGRLSFEHGRQPFDLTCGPLLSLKLLRLSDIEHVLLMTVHHIIWDGWSMHVFSRDLEAIYSAICAGETPSLPPPQIQYADFAHWQREWMQGDELEDHLAYWRGQLGGDLPTLELPTDHPRPSTQSFRGARHIHELPPALVEGLRALSQREGATLFMTLVAGFQTLMHRYSGQDDILLGSPIASRTQDELEGLIGFFVNSLVLRTDMSGNPSFRELLGRVRKVTLDALAHQDVPFEKLVEELQPERDPSRNPIFQVFLGLQNASMSDLRLPGLKTHVEEISNGTTKFDISLTIEETETTLRVRMEYGTDLFTPATIARMQRHYQSLLEGAVADPSQRLSDLPLLTDEEREQLLVEWNATRQEYPLEMCIHELVEAQVERTPDAVAIVAGDRHLSYRALNERANQLAHYLRAQGVGPEVQVGVLVERSPEMIVGILGIVKAGGAYVPLDPVLPRERLGYIIEDTAAPVLLTQQGLLARLPEHSAKVVRLDADWPAIAREPTTNPAGGALADNLAYTIYTSGSTGKPKGVLIAHRGLINLVHWHQRVYGVTAQDRTPQLGGLGFDAIVWEVWSHLTAGAQILLIDEEVRLEPAKLRDWLIEKKITITHLPTRVAEIAVTLPWKPGIGLSRVYTGGDKLHRVPPASCPFALYNNYGPSEYTVVSTYLLVPPSEHPESAPPIGRPVDNTQMFLLDRFLNPVPIGVPGELYIGGVGLARGYLNRPDLTAEKFLPNPFSSTPGARFYRTADLIRYLPDGNLDFLGRLDNLVKIRGVRIEPGEIETILGQHPAVQEVTVVVREDTPGDKRLVAYVVSSSSRPPSLGELRSHLKQQLPEYMVPASFVLLDALPLTPNGKVDRKALPAPERVRPELQDTFVAPRNPTESTLERIWADVLNLDQLGVNDNFFALGGHSLLATQAISRANSTFQVEMSVSSLFESPTIAEFAQLVEHERQSSAAKTRKPIMRIDRSSFRVG